MSDLDALISDAYLYGYPLVAGLDEVVRFTTSGVGSQPQADLNQFSHAGALAGPADTFVTINNDTVYSTGNIDLSGGPVLLQVPDTGGAYYVVQFIDAWTNNFAYVGKRATGTEEGHYLLVPPGFDASSLPYQLSEVVLIHAPTVLVTAFARFACDGPDDLSRVRELQEQLTLTPLNAQTRGMPVPDSRVDPELLFWEKFRVWMRAFPPAVADVDYQQRFAPLGLLAAESPYLTMDPELRAALVRGLADARDALETFTHTGTVVPVNGWMGGLHMFDYNLDFFEVGTIDAPEWRLDTRSAAHRERALAARLGLWGNHGYEACYSQVFVDTDGQQLHGGNEYIIHFDRTPPVDAFWSLTMYDVPNYFLVQNPIDRYSIGDRTPGLQFAVDGSLTLHLASAPPADPAARANWLPAPAAPFRPILRMYGPQAPVLSSEYRIPGLQRVSR
jgi:hypothetical protein